MSAMSGGRKEQNYRYNIRTFLVGARSGGRREHDSCYNIRTFVVGARRIDNKSEVRVLLNLITTEVRDRLNLLTRARLGAKEFDTDVMVRVQLNLIKEFRVLVNLKTRVRLGCY